MLSSFLCCFPHSQRAPNNDSPVTGVNTMTPVVDGRIFRDRLGAIVCSTERSVACTMFFLVSQSARSTYILSKMVNVGARMPFYVTFQNETPASAHAQLVPHSSPTMSTPGASGSTPLSRRRLPVLTMTPASACNMHSSSASSVTSSRTGSRTSSPRRRLAGTDRGRWTYLYSDCASEDDSAAGVSCGASESDGAASASVSACATPVDVGPKGPTHASHANPDGSWDGASGRSPAAVAIIDSRHWQKEPADAGTGADADVTGPPLSITFSWGDAAGV
ncbi:hypothetical protein GGX14DRAFT_453807 [Mycena pura]|uniref:Uncharacterized protein n=1 Tax=Mycena pura TaxID=153505 RepID=A0AAD6VFS5_9AGAR|nr:hypothetical protein GGX14DRAFT_453807 [Mycena pura]